MSDPQDLLYTNKFISTDILSDTQLIKETEYYDRFKNYIDNNLTDEIKKYVENDETESSAVNIDKTLNTKWPIYSNKNHYPLFDTYTNDISTNRYKKEIITKINIDSRYRDVSAYPNNNDFNIKLNKVFNNVKKIVINDIIITNVDQSITNVNNNLSWQYASQNFLVGQNIDLTIIPVPSKDNTISYSNLPNSVYQYNTSSGSTVQIDKYLVYQTTVSPGYYAIDDLLINLRLSTSSIIHGLNLKNNPGIKVVEEPYLAYPKRLGTPHLFSCSINPISSVVKFVNRIEEVKISAIQTFSPYESEFRNTDIFYYFSSQYSVSTSYILNTSYIYIILPAISDITYQYYQNINCIYTPNAFPLVITDLDISAGNIDPELINYTEFYDIQLYLQNGYTEDQLDSISYYKFIDTLIFTNTIPSLAGGLITVRSNYLRFALSLSTGNITGNNYNTNGTRIRPSTTSNIVFSSGLNKILTSYNNNSTIQSTEGSFNSNGVVSESGSFNSIGVISGSFNTTGATGATGETGETGETGATGATGATGSIKTTGSIGLTGSIKTTGTSVENYTYNYYTSGIITDYQFLDKNLYIGRALLFRWIYDIKGDLYLGYEYDTDNEKKKSLLHVLGWPIANQTENIYVLEQNKGFKFVHTNYQSQVIYQASLLSSNISSNNYPIYTLRLQYYANKYFFVNNNYIYLKIYFDSHQNLEENTQFINTVSSKSMLYNQVYINSSQFNVDIGQDYSCLKGKQYITTYKKDQSYIFTKILLSDIPGNTDIKLSNIINNNSFYIYYDSVKDNIDSVKIELFDANMKLLFTNANYSFTINIHEIKDILKETLVNSKNNNVTTTGHFI